MPLFPLHRLLTGYFSPANPFRMNLRTLIYRPVVAAGRVGVGNPLSASKLFVSIP